MKEKIIILEHAGISYISLGYYGMHAESLIVNGKQGAANVCPGNARWLMFDGVIESLKQVQPSAAAIVGWTLREEYRSVTQFPTDLPADAFRYDGDEECYVPCDASAVYQAVFYDRKVEHLVREPIDLEFLVIDRNCAPIAKPDDIKVDFPASLRAYPDTWHKHPVTISGDALFARAASAVVEAVRERSKDFSVADYRNIGTLTLTGLMHHEPKKSEYKVGRRTVRKTLTHSEFKIMSLANGASSYAKDADVVCRTLQGNNWEELEAKIAQFIDMVLSYIRPGSVRVCECCKGDGYVLTMSDAMLRAREAS